MRHLGVPLGRERYLFDPGLVALGQSLDVRRVAELVEEPVSKRRGILELAHVVQSMHRVADVGRRHRIVPGQEFGILVLPDALEVRAELVLPGGLIGQPHQRIPHVLALDGRISDLVPLVRDGIERVAYTLIHRHMTAGREEP